MGVAITNGQNNNRNSHKLCQFGQPIVNSDPACKCTIICRMGRCTGRQINFPASWITPEVEIKQKKPLASWASDPEYVLVLMIFN